MRKPYWRFGLAGLVSALALAVAILVVQSLAVGTLPSWLVPNPIQAWWLGITVATAGVFRYDKSIAGSRRTRVPEAVLLIMVAVGGTLGAAAAMWMIRPRHKTRSAGFLLRFLAMAAAQIIAAVIYWVWR